MPIFALAFASDGTLAISYQGETTSTWIYKASAPPALLETRFNVHEMAFLSRGVLALVCSDSRDKWHIIFDGGEILLHDPETHVQRCIPIGPFSMASFSSNDQLALWMDDMDKNNSIHVYDLTTSSYLSLDSCSLEISALAFTFSNKCLIASSYDEPMCSWDLESRTKTFIGTIPDLVTSIASSPDGKLAIASPVAKEIRLWEAGSKKASPSERTLDPGPIQHIVFSHDGKQLASVSLHVISVMDSPTRREFCVFQRYKVTPFITSIAFSGKYLASGHYDGTILVWDPAARNPLVTLRGHSGHVGAVAFSPNNRILASVDYLGNANFWDSNTWGLQRTLSFKKENFQPSISIAFSQNSTRFAGIIRGSVAIWDAEKYICLQSLQVSLPRHSWYYNNQISKFAESYIDTTYGRILLDLPSGSTSNEREMLLNRWRIDDDWLIRDGRKLLWLPPDFRPLCMAIYDDLLVLGHHSGKLSFFEGNVDKGTSE